MKILHVEDVFYPNAGYQINILPKYMSKVNNEIVIITSQTKKNKRPAATFFGKDDIEEKDKKYEDETGVKIVRLQIHGFLGSRVLFKKNVLFKKIKEHKPDILYVHGNDTLTAMQILKARKKFGCPLVMDSHMLEMASKNKLNKLFRWYYKKFYTPIVKKENIPVIRTQNDNYVEKCLGIPLKQAPWVSYGSDTILFHPDQQIRDKFRKEYNISENAFVVVYAGKLDDAKGGKFFAECIQKKIETDKELIFVIVGNTSGEYEKGVEDIFAGSENRIIRFPTQKYTDLAKFFQSADLAVFPKQCSLSFYDVQACGLPVLSEDNNINVDRCSHKNGWNFKAGDIEDFRLKLQTIVDMPKLEYSKYSHNAYEFIRKNYNYEDKAREYEKIIEDTYKTWKELKN